MFWQQTKKHIRNSKLHAPSKTKARDINLAGVDGATIERHWLYCQYTVGLVVEYSPATGETRVRFPDGVLGGFIRGTSHFCVIQYFFSLLFLPFLFLFHFANG